MPEALGHDLDGYGEDLQFPCGGRRYRPITEDVIEFVIVEGLITKSSDESQAILRVLDKRRADFQRIQLVAAIRNDVATETLALDELGYEVTHKSRTRRPPGKARTQPLPSAAFCSVRTGRHRPGRC